MTKVALAFMVADFESEGVTATPHCDPRYAREKSLPALTYLKPTFVRAKACGGQTGLSSLQEMRGGYPVADVTQHTCRCVARDC